MGVLDFILRNSLWRSLGYIILVCLVFSVFSFKYENFINPFDSTSLIEFIFDDSIYHNIHLFFESWETIDKATLSIIIMVGLLLINSHSIIKLVSFHKEINMPYALNFFNPIRKFEWQENQVKTSHDRFLKSTYDSIFYKNSIAIDIEKYENSKNAIVQYLNLPDNYEVGIKRYKNKCVQIHFSQLPIAYFFDESEYKKGYINIGFSSKGIYYTKLLDVTHLLVCGESGSGKSNLMHHLLKSIFINIKSIQSIEMIDLKGTELYRYRIHSKVNFIDTVEEVRDRLVVLKKEMNSRFTEMKKNNEQVYKGKFMFIIIDEVGTIGTHPNKKLRDEIFSLLIEIFQKGRASKVIGQLYTQSITNDSLNSGVLKNVQSKVLMKTDSDFNINNTIGTKESIEKITRIDPDSFPRGRMIYKDGVSSEKILIQAPIIDFDNKKAVI